MGIKGAAESRRFQRINGPVELRSQAFVPSFERRRNLQ